MVDLKRISFSIIICFLFISILSFGINTFIPRKTIDCYSRFIKEPIDNNVNKSGVIEVVDQEALTKCLEENNAMIEKIDSLRFLTILIITSLTLFFITRLKLVESVKYGLFFGSTISLFVSTLTYQRLGSLIYFLILLVLFIIIILLVQREEIMKKPKITRRKSRKR